MEKYLIQSKNKSYFQLEKMKDKLGRANHLGYLYEYESTTSKANFEYALLINEIATAYPILKKVKTWLDICCSPGDYDNYLQYYLKTAKGSGITLSPEKGGMKFIYDLPGYTLYYHDILKDTIQLPIQYDLIITGCLNMDLKNKKNKDDELMTNSFVIGMRHLKVGGTFIFKTSTKRINLLTQFYYWMSTSFDSVDSYKSPYILTHRSVFYIIGQGYRGGNPSVSSILKEDFSYVEPVKDKIVPLLESVFNQQTAGIISLLESETTRSSFYHFDTKIYWIHFTQGKKVPSLEQEYGFYQEYANKSVVDILKDYLTLHKWMNPTRGTEPAELLVYPKEMSKLPKNMAIRYSVLPKKYHHRLLLPINVTRFLSHRGFSELFTSYVTHQLPKFVGMFYDLEAYYGSTDLNDPSLGPLYVNVPMISRDFSKFMLLLLIGLHYRKRRPMVIMNGFTVRMEITVPHHTFECRGEFTEVNTWTNEQVSTQSQMQMIILGELSEKDIQFLLFCLKTNKIVYTVDK